MYTLAITFGGWLPWLNDKTDEITRQIWRDGLMHGIVMGAAVVALLWFLNTRSK